MDFNTILQACYKNGITPFELYCSMLDFCKGDLEIKEQIGVLYNLYKQRDIFDEISLCEEVDFALFLEKYPQKERDCVKKIAIFIHPGWIVVDERKKSNKQKIKIQRAVINTIETQRKVLFQHDNNVKRQVVNFPKIKVQNNNGALQVAKRNVHKPKNIAAKSSVEIKSLLSNLEILTSATATNVEIFLYNAGKRLYHKGGIVKRKTCVYVNVEEVVAEKIEIIIPKDKYSQLKVYKTSGSIIVNDKENCFEGLSIVGCAGDISCHTSTKNLYASTDAGNINLDYVALQEGKIDVRNTLGNVNIQTFFAKKIMSELFSLKGTVFNNHKQTAGPNVAIKVKSKYGNINVS